MSSQPTTVEKAKDTANAAYESVANTVAGTSSDPRNQPGYNPNQDPSNFDQDAHGNTFKKGDFKDQLNRAATEDSNKGSKKPDGIVETGKLLQTTEERTNANTWTSKVLYSRARSCS